MDLPREVDCMRCGAPTSGLATCELCFEAITELRALAIDHDAPNTAPFRHLPRSLARTEVDRIGSVDAGE